MLLYEARSLVRILKMNPVSGGLTCQGNAKQSALVLQCQHKLLFRQIVLSFP